MLPPRTRRIIGLGVVLSLVLIEPCLALPGASPVLERTPAVRSGDAVPARLVALRASARPLSRPFIWPITGRLTSGFGRRGFWGWHTGVDIVARRGTRIRAAAPGIVTYSGWQSSYGRVIRIAHRDGYSTVYAHNSRNFVTAGDRVERGTVIGSVGRTGRATADHLHLEVRRYGIPRNPLVFLQQQPLTPGAAATTHDRLTVASRRPTLRGAAPDLASQMRDRAARSSGDRLTIMEPSEHTAWRAVDSGYLLLMSSRALPTGPGRGRHRRRGRQA